MKFGKSLIDCSAVLKRQSQVKSDFLAPTTALALTPATQLELENHQFSLTHYAHRQIAQRLGIPERDYNKMLVETPGLLAENVNTWFNRNPEKRLGASAPMY